MTVPNNIVEIVQPATNTSVNTTVDTDNAGGDAFGAQRVSQRYTIFDSKCIYDKQPLFFDEVNNGTATSAHDTGEASVTMSVSANGDYAIRQTFMRFDYQPSKSQQIFFTGVLGDPVANTEAKIGYYNSSTASPYSASIDGIYFGTDGSDVYVAISKGGTETKVLQSAWNIDKMDGTGDSGIAVDWDSTQIFEIDFQYLGVGRVRFGLDIDGVLYYVHEINNANAAQTGAYMNTPNHSIRCEIRSTGGTNSIKQICSAVISEGGVDPAGVTRSVSNGITSITCGTVEEGILFYRLNSGRPSTTLELSSFSVLNSSNNANNYKWSIILNPTIAGTAPTYSQVGDSALDVAPGAGDNTLTNGTVLLSGYASGSVPTVELPANLLVNAGIAIDGTQDEIALSIQTFSGTDTFVGAFNIREVTCG